MRYLILVPDGCGDWPIMSLNGRTPLEAANIKHINTLAKVSETGLVRTIPAGIAPGSDAANLSILGYDPAVYLTGRAPLEAAGMGIDMSEADVAFRVNMVTLDGDGQFGDLVVKDHSAGELGSREAEILIKFLSDELGDKDLRFYPGISYRCLLITDKLQAGSALTPPHDILDQQVGPHMPKGDGAEKISYLMRRSYELLKNHPLNHERLKNGLNPANAVWLWGQGKKPGLPPLESMYGIKGSVVAAVNLIKGIGVCAGLSVVHVPGADGTIRTNFEGKASGAINEFRKGKDFVFLHIEAPDECSHNGDQNGKIKSLEFIDEKILRPVALYLESTGEPYRILIIADHKTPLKIQTHSDEPVPFVLYDSENKQPEEIWKSFSEASGAKGIFYENCRDLAKYFFRC